MTYSFVDTRERWYLADSSATLSETLPSLLHDAEVTEVGLVTVSRMPSLRGRDISEEARTLTSLARSEHRSRGFGFWDFLLAEAARSDDATREALIRRAVQHNPLDPPERVPVDAFVDRLVRGTFEDLPARTIVSLTSQVRVSAHSTVLHLPMLDFSLRAEDRADKAALDVAGALGLTGDLFRSGTSYHLISDFPVDSSALWQILGRAQLLSPLIDHRWAAHQLIDGSCALRISTDSERHTQPHRLVATTRSNVQDDQ